MREASNRPKSPEILAPDGVIARESEQGFLQPETRGPEPGPFSMVAVPVGIALVVLIGVAALVRGRNRGRTGR